MNTVYFLLFLLPRIAQSAPNAPLYLRPPIAAPLQDPTGSFNITPTFIPISAQPSPIPLTLTDEVPFLLPLPALSPPSTPYIMAYYPDWAGPDSPPEKIDFARFDWIDFAFALPTKDCSLTWDDPDTAPLLLGRLVTAAHSKGKKVKLSVGGWTGSKYFSSVVATDHSRKTFVENIYSLYIRFNLDGIDIDWEYPGYQGQAGNEVSEYDTANFLAFLKLLRDWLPSDAAISAAALTIPFYGPDGEPMTDVSEFAKYLDWILIMNYDVWGASSTPGPNAPLVDACHNSTQPEASAAAAAKAWTSAGFPASQLVLGVPSYGYVSKSTATRLRTRQNQVQSVKLASGGQIQFRDLVEQGALVRNSNGSFSGGGGFTRYYDECSCTPFLRSPSSGQIVTYDDPQSLGLKAALAKRTGMLGVNMFDWTGDTDNGDLVDAIRQGFDYAS
ncbi:glycoside hydrolase superfamily [Mycena haematopus]|nr:glycoside hydrolase superfamily [Mycena haematopus]